MVEAQMIDTADYRSPLFIAAAYGQLGRPEEAARALFELRARWPGSAGDIRQELIERNAHAPDLADHLMEGLRMAGLEEIESSKSP